MLDEAKKFNGALIKAENRFVGLAGLDVYGFYFNKAGMCLTFITGLVYFLMVFCKKYTNPIGGLANGPEIRSQTSRSRTTLECISTFWQCTF